MNEETSGLMGHQRHVRSAWRGSFYWGVLSVAMTIGWSGSAWADYRKALEAYNKGRYEQVLAEVRRANPIADKEGLRALVRVIDADQSDGKPPFPSSIPHRAEIAVALDKAAEATGDGESIYRLRSFVPRPWPSNPTRLSILRYKKAAELGYAPAQYGYATMSPRPHHAREVAELPDLVIGEREFVEWIRRAAEGGYIQAQIFMAGLRQWIRYGLKDPVLKRELSESLPPSYWVDWMEKAAANEEFDSGLSHPGSLASARASLAGAYTKGLFGAPVDYDRAYKWASLAAAAGAEYAHVVLETLRSKGYKPAVEGASQNSPSQPLSPTRQ